MDAPKLTQFEFRLWTEHIHVHSSEQDHKFDDPKAQMTLEDDELCVGWVSHI